MKNGMILHSGEIPVKPLGFREKTIFYKRT